LNDSSTSDVVFTTDRIIVRRWRDEDLEAVFAVYSDEDAMRWVDDGRAITWEECEHWLVVTRNNYARYGYGMFALELKRSPGVFGFCGIVHPNGQTEPEIKYALLRSQWGKGLATEAVVGLIDYGAEQHELQYMIATTAPENTASHNVLLKSGMTRADLRKEADGSQTQVFHWQAGQSS
jgi:RimJ/RimL family protein N-acetyltransferase